MESVRAWVHCGARQMAYARAGSGRTLVLLTEWTSEAPLPAIFEALTKSFRVIVPELSTGNGCGCGVVDLLDTLGVSRVSLIADAAFAADALQAARDEPERIERVALITPSLGGEEPMSLRVVTLDENPTPEQIEALVTFVNEQG